MVPDPSSAHLLIILTVLRPWPLPASLSHAMESLLHPLERNSLDLKAIFFSLRGHKGFHWPANN